ncbi:hypothetical protein P7K49_019851 [Saguinus oedipus]|uniref:Protein FAM186A n=1 Tax=Saguinus oedipus TaxID=9490 RepID=A0ABQ9UYJ2_SAGOE|nr:hypothetical protein P7K49_019851 [Saguinus oedipus]
MKRPATAHALRPDQMISNQFATNTKVSEIQGMLQELIATTMFSTLENNAIKYISSTIVNLSKALSALSDELKCTNFQSSTIYEHETSEAGKELSLKIIQDLSNENEMLQQKLHDAEEKCEQLLRSKIVTEHVYKTLSASSTVKALSGSSPQSSRAIIKAGDVEDNTDNILDKELENIVDEVQRKQTKGSGIKWDSTILYTAQVETTPDLTEQQQQPVASKDISEDGTKDYVSLKKGDEYQAWKKKHTKGTHVDETSEPNLSDNKGGQEVSEAKPSQYYELLEKKRKEKRSFSEVKSKSPTEAKGQHLFSTETKSQGGRSRTSIMLEQFRKVKRESPFDRRPTAPEIKVEPTTEALHKESKSEIRSLVEPLSTTQSDYTADPQKGKIKGRKHHISSGTTTSKEEKTEEKEVLTKQVKSHQLIKSLSRVAKEISESTRVLESPDGKSEQSNLEEFQNAIMAFLKQKIDNIGKPFDKKTVLKEDELLKRAEAEKLGIIKAKMEEYFQKVAETVTKILRKYKDKKKEEQVRKPEIQKKVVSFMPGLHFQKSESSTFLSHESTDPVINNLIQMILAEIESERDVSTVSTVQKDHKEREEQSQEQYLQEDQEQMTGMSLKQQLLERNLLKEHYKKISENWEEKKAYHQMKEGKQKQQRQKQWQEEIWKTEQKQRTPKQTEQEEKQKQRGQEEEELPESSLQRLEEGMQKMKAQGLLLEKENGQMRQIQKEVKHLGPIIKQEKEKKKQKPERGLEDFERQRQTETKDWMQMKKIKPKELEKVVIQTPMTLSPRWKSTVKGVWQLYQGEESHRNLKTLENLPDEKKPIPVTPPSPQSSPPGALPISGQPLTPQQAQKVEITLTPQQAQELGIPLTPQQAQELGIPLTPQQAQELGIPLTPQQAQAQGIPFTPQQAQALGIPLTPQEAQELGIPLTHQQAQDQGITLTSQQAQELGITLTLQQAQAQGITLTPQQAQELGITLTPQQAQALGIPLTPQQPQVQKITLTPQQAQDLGIPLTPQQAQELRITLTPQQAQALGIPLTPQQAQAQGITLTSQQAQALGIPLTPQQAQALGIPLTPQQPQVQKITLTPQQAQDLGIPLTPQQAQELRITLTPQQAQALGIPLTPQQAQAQEITLTSQQAQALGIPLTPQQAQALGIPLTPQQAQDLGIPLTPQQAQELRITLTPQQAQALGIPLTPQQAQAQGITLTSQQAQELGITLTPQQTQALDIPLTPQQAQVLGIPLTPQQAQALGIPLTPQQAQAQEITLTSQQAQALGIPLTPQQAQALGIPLTPQQAQDLGIPLTPQQAQELRITLTPQQAQALGIPLTPQQAQAQGITLTSQQAQELGITLTPQQTQALDIPLTPQQAQVLGIPLTPQQAQALGIPLTPQQAQTQKIILTPQQAQALGIPLTPQQAQELGIPLTPWQAQEPGIALTPQELGIALTPQQAQAQEITLTPQQAQALGVPITSANAWMSAVTLTPVQTQALESPINLEQAQEQSLKLGVPLTLDKAHALGSLLTLNQVQPLGFPFTPGQVQPVRITLLSEHDPKSRASVTPRVPHILKQQAILATPPHRPFQESKASLPTGQSIISSLSPSLRLSLASSAPTAEKSSIFGVSSPLQMSKLPLNQGTFAPGKPLEMGILPEAEKLGPPQTLRSSGQTLVYGGQSTSVQLPAPQALPTPGQLPVSGAPPTPGQPFEQEALSSRELFKTGASLTPLPPQMSKAPLAPRQQLITAVPPTFGQIPSLWAPLFPGQPLVPGASSIHGDRLQSGSLTFSEQLQEFQPPATAEQSPHLQAPSTLGQHLAPWILPGQASSLWIPPTPRHPPTLWTSPTPGKPQRVWSPSFAKKRLAFISSLKSKSALIHPSAPDFKVSQVPFTTKKFQMSEVSETSEETQILRDPFAIESFITFQSHLTKHRTLVSQSPYTDEGALPTLMKPTTSLSSLTTLLKTSQISPPEWYQKSRFPPIDKPWILSSVSGTKKPKIMVPSSSPKELEEKRYFVDVEAQKKNLILLNQAIKTCGFPSQLHTTARTLIIEIFHMDTVQLGYLFRKYIAYRLIQYARNNIMKLLKAIQNTGKGYEARNLYVMLSRLDDYQKKVMQVWTEKQKSLGQKRNQCLKKMIHVFDELRKIYELNLSQPIPLIIKEKQIPASTTFVQKPFLKLLMEEDRTSDIFKKFRYVLERLILNFVWMISLETQQILLFHPSVKVGRANAGQQGEGIIGLDGGEEGQQEDQREAIWNVDLSTTSYPIAEKTSMHSLWAQLGGYPDIPRLLQLDVQSTFRKSLASLQSQ